MPAGKDRGTVRSQGPALYHSGRLGHITWSMDSRKLLDRSLPNTLVTYLVFLKKEKFKFYALLNYTPQNTDTR